MIDPSSLMKPEINQTKSMLITLNEIPEYDGDEYDLSNSSGLNKYLKDIEKDVRGSFEYREMIRYLKDYAQMFESGSFEYLSSADSGVTKEIHHTPFSLYDIVTIVYRKREFYHENLMVQMVAKEVMELHYKQLVGLYPLTKTEHQLVHNFYLFIPVYKVFGRYDLFASLYSDFIDPDMKETLANIEEYSKIASEEENKKLLSQNNIYLDTSGSYSLPVFDKLKLALEDQVSKIKQNSYMLPVFEEETEASRIQSKNRFQEAISFY